MSNFEEFESKGTNKTDKEVTLILKGVTILYRELYSELSVLFNDVYAEAAVNKGTYSSLYMYLLHKKKYSKFIKEVRTLYNNTNKEITKLIKKAAELGLTNEYYRKLYALQQNDSTIAFKKIPILLQKLIIEGTEEQQKQYEKDYNEKYGNITKWIGKYGTVSKNMQKHSQKELDSIELLITSCLLGLISRKTFLKETKRKIGYTETKKVNGVTVKKTYGGLASSLKIANTETIRALNAGSYLVTLDLYLDQGLDSMYERVWSAILDNKTRDQSVIMHGQTVELDEPFTYPNGVTAMYPGESGVAAYDINERCTVLERLKDDDDDKTYSWNQFDDWLDNNGLSQTDNDIIT